jgi:hypothetical protein
MKVFLALTLPILACGSEIWTLRKKKIKKPLISIDMHFSEEQPGVAPFWSQKE